MKAMKNYISIFLIVSFSLSLFGQATEQKKADDLFIQKSYIKAASIYEKIPESQEILQNLGDCYYYNGMVNDALRIYGKLFLTYKKDIKPEYYFKYAHTIYGTGDFVKADAIMTEYNKFNVNTPKFIQNLENTVPYNYQVQIMTKNTSNGDFGIAYYDDKVVFASYRNTANQSFGWNDKPYLDLFVGKVNTNGQLINVAPFSKEINTKTHESSPTFSEDGKTMYFSRTNDKRVKVGEETFASIKIFKAELVNNKWTNINPLPFCSDVYSCEHPALSSDGKKLYFSSDMPGTIGSFDIYVVDINEDGTFGTPQNMGATINTIHREQFPFITKDGSVLYFASDGHQGIGGLDIFMSKSYDGQFSKPLNLGKSINSSLDDFAYALDEKTNSGYFSSNRKNSDNLYSFKRIENEERYTVEGEVKDKNTKSTLPGTKVTLYDENDKLIGQMVVGINADYSFNTEPNKKYRIEAMRDFYIPHSEFFTTNDKGKMKYTIELFVECYDDAEEIVTKKIDGRLEVVLENIYFDFNKWDIKPEAAQVLNVLLDLLKKYPVMEIELGAHTDSRASEVYNMVLSNRRAASALEYLVQNGIDKNRLRSKGYGESQPLVDCKDNCTDEEHSINRRCEFIITR